MTRCGSFGFPVRTRSTQAVSALRLIQREDDEGAIQAFLESADTLAKVLPRARLIEECVTDTREGRAGSEARDALQQVAPVLKRELEGSDPVHEATARLRDHLSSETFYNHLSAIRECSRGPPGVGSRTLYSRGLQGTPMRVPGSA